MCSRLALVLCIIALVAILFSCSDDGSAPVSGGLTMEEAVQTVQDSLPGEIPPNAKYFCLKMDGPISKGSTIAEAGPEPLPGSPQTAPAVALALTEDTYFFYLDLEPGAYFDHPVKYITIGKSSGSYGVTDANWWPEVDGETPSHILDDIPDAQYVVGSNTSIVIPGDMNMLFEIPISSILVNEGFIVVQGLLENEKLYDEAITTYQNGLNFFNAYKNSSSRVQGLFGRAADEVRGMIDEMVAEGRDVITLYIIAHGSVDAIGLGGWRFNPSHFRNKMAQYPDVMFNFMLGSCHSGSFIDDLQTLDNVRVVVTACRTEESAFPDWDVRDMIADFNHTDSGSEWTSSMLTAMNHIRSNAGYWSFVQEWALMHGVPVTSVLLTESFAGSLGQNANMGLTTNYDLSNRTGYATPDVYRSWLQ